MKQEVTFLTTWDNDIIEIEIDFKTWLKTKNKAKNNWEDWIYLKSHKRYLKFSNIKDEKWKTKYLALEQPKKEIKEITEEERKKIEEFKKTILEKTFEWRKKRFYQEREKILKDLEKKEQYFWLQTTLSKIEEYNILKLKNNLWKNLKK